MELPSALRRGCTGSDNHGKGQYKNQVYRFDSGSPHGKHDSDVGSRVHVFITARGPAQRPTRDISRYGIFVTRKLSLSILASNDGDDEMTSQCRWFEFECTPSSSSTSSSSCPQLPANTEAPTASHSTHQCPEMKHPPPVTLGAVSWLDTFPLIHLA